MAPRFSRPALMLATALTLSAFGATAAFAQDPDAQLGTIEKQIKSLQAELHHMKMEAAERDRALKQAQARAYAPPPATSLAPVMPHIPAGYALVPAAPGSAPGSVVLARAEAPKEKPKATGVVDIGGGVTLKLGGFFEAAGVYRSRNEVTDLGSSFTSGIPERNSALYHEGETVLSSRQSRIQAALSAEPDEVTKLSGFFAMDFLGGAPTANYNESNSWNPRIREAWIDYARSDLGLYILGGQTWSLATMNKLGVDPTKIDSPLQIDPQYVVGFDWARQSQFRIAKNLGSNQYWLALSIENSATIVSGTAPTLTGKTINQSNSGTGNDGTGGSFTNNFIPDVIVKGTADYPFGHFEAFALGRAFNNRVSELGSGENNTVYGGGIGGGAMIHIIPKLLDLHVSGLFGDGVGRYGTSGLADATYNAQGKPVALPGYSGYAGLIGHPNAENDIYAYFGVEHVDARYDTGLVKGKLATLAGYGSDLLSNAGCGEELSPLTCSATTSGDAQITVGNWYKFEHGRFGLMEVGLQYSYTRRFVFQGLGATPKTDDNMLFFSYRWYPFD